MASQFRRLRRRAFASAYAAIMMVALAGVVSLGVDWGRVQTAKAELQNAVDAASRYAVTGVRDNTYLAKAQQAAVQNRVDGTDLVLTAADVEVGTWDANAREFTPGGANRNAVRVTGWRTATRSNAVPLIFGRAIGKDSVNIKAVAIACQDVTPYSVVALNSVTMSNASTIKRTALESSSGSVVVASNGTWSLGASASIIGDALYRGSVPTGNITGDETPMAANIGYSIVNAPTGTTAYPPINYTSGFFYVGGNYSTSACTVGGSFTITLTADTNVYCSGNVSFGGNVNVITNGYKFTIYMTGAGGTIAMTNNLPVSVVIYGPNAAMTVNSVGKITGSFVCKSLNMTNGVIEYTSALPIPVSPTGGGASATMSGVSTVQ